MKKILKVWLRTDPVARAPYTISVDDVDASADDRLEEIIDKVKEFLEGVDAGDTEIAFEITVDVDDEDEEEDDEEEEERDDTEAREIAMLDELEAMDDEYMTDLQREQRHQWRMQYGTPSERRKERE